MVEVLKTIKLKFGGPNPNSLKLSRTNSKNTLKNLDYLWICVENDLVYIVEDTIEGEKRFGGIPIEWEKKCSLIMIYKSTQTN